MIACVKLTTVDGSEIPNNQLGCIKPVVNSRNFTISTDAGFFPSTVGKPKFAVTKTLVICCIEGGDILPGSCYKPT